jgi:hypothetical protein
MADGATSVADRDQIRRHRRRRHRARPRRRSPIRAPAHHNQAQRHRVLPRAVRPNSDHNRIGTRRQRQPHLAPEPNLHRLRPGARIGTPWRRPSRSNTNRQQRPANRRANPIRRHHQRSRAEALSDAEKPPTTGRTAPSSTRHTTANAPPIAVHASDNVLTRRNTCKYIFSRSSKRGIRSPEQGLIKSHRPDPRAHRCRTRRRRRDSRDPVVQTTQDTMTRRLSRARFTDRPH